MNVAKKLVNTGTHANMEAGLIRRVQITNSLSLFLAFLSLLFLTNELIIDGDPLQPIFALSTFLLIVGFNKFGLHNLSRIILSVVPGAMITVMHLAFIAKDDSILTSLYLCQAAIAFIPWLIFDFHEKAKIYILSLFNLAFLLAYKFNLGYAPVKVSHLGFENGPIGFITVCAAFLILAALFYSLNKIHDKQQKENQMLIGKMEESQLEMEEKSRELGAYIEQVEIAKKEEEQRQWKSEGISHINQLFQNHQQNEENLKDPLLQYLVKHLEVNQGALFELTEEEDRKWLEMTACYAYNRKKYLNKKIEIGEGLVGQCYLEEDYIYLEEVPEKYVNITSGLGKALPRMILLVPLIAQNKVVGVVEFASFKRMEKHQVNFIKEAGESIASYLISERINQETRRLLEESQSQSEHMKNQEEELRQNMEEMTAVQEEFSRKQNELEKIINLKDEQINQLTERLKQVEG